MTAVPQGLPVVDISALDGKVRPTISGPLAVYIRELLRTGLYGDRETDVVRTLVGDGIRRAVTKGIIQAKRFEKGRPA